ncbi:MAG: hypothetical protein ISN28_01480 [Ectothiorhodospiraceae bacterium AqS1]|nr:hypothetical protein [Ectothiorhodospiraceae bacterium AqS1]
MDKENPRLLTDNLRKDDENIIAQLYRSDDLSELILSIATNGYMDIEPLIVMLDEDDRKFIVLEGNRRLATIRLFREPDLVSRVQKRTPIDLPNISDEIIRTLDKVSVYRVHHRREALSFIGFKHINGPAKWNAYAKATFAAKWLKEEGLTIDKIANKIGDRHDTVKRMIVAIHVLEQAQQKNIYSLSDRKSSRFNFSHLYTALSRKDYRDYLGIGDDDIRNEPRENPVPDDHLKELKNILIWIYGSKESDIEALVKTHNPDIKKLGETLSSDHGLSILQAGGTLAEAYASTIPARSTFYSAILEARRHLQSAVSSLRGYDGSEKSYIDFAEEILEFAQILRERMKKKLEENSESEK